MSEGAPKTGERLYAAAFLCALVAGASLFLDVLSRSLASGNSLVSITFSVAAIILGVLSLRK